eukprot:11209512-Alexandrium_andersonii.AAC.1
MQHWRFWCQCTRCAAVGPASEEQTVGEAAPSRAASDDAGSPPTCTDGRQAEAPQCQRIGQHRLYSGRWSAAL